MHRKPQKHTRSLLTNNINYEPHWQSHSKRRTGRSRPKRSLGMRSFCNARVFCSIGSKCNTHIFTCFDDNFPHRSNFATNTSSRMMSFNTIFFIYTELHAPRHADQSNSQSKALGRKYWWENIAFQYDYGKHQYTNNGTFQAQIFYYYSCKYPAIVHDLAIENACLRVYM